MIFRVIRFMTLGVVVRFMTLGVVDRIIIIAGVVLFKVLFKLIERFMALGVGGIIIIAAVILFIDGFLPWYSFSASGEVLGERFSVSWSANGWESPGAIWSMLAIFIGLALAAVVVLKKLTEVEIPDNVGGVSWPKIFLGGGVAALVFVLIKLLNESSHLGFGFYLGIIAAGALAVAGFLMYREESGLAGSE